MERGTKKTIIGLVVSDKMDKTLVVRLNRKVRHKKYHKIVTKSGHVKVHDEKNECRNGDIVSAMETRPLSKQKRWRLVEILERSER